MYPIAFHQEVLTAGEHAYAIVGRAIGPNTATDVIVRHAVAALPEITLVSISIPHDVTDQCIATAGAHC